MSRYSKLLLSREGQVGVWGVGYIGYSTMAYYADAGVQCVGFDIDQRRVDGLNSGAIPIPGLESWLDVDSTPLVAGGLMRATMRSEELLSNNVPVHFICVPTEQRGRPWLDALKDVALKLTAATQRDSTFRPLVIIESTLTPGTTDDVLLPLFEQHGVKVGSDLLLCIAPRRDWFVAKGQSLRNLDRIYGGVNDESADEAFAVLNIVCSRLHQASNHRVAEMVKCVENAYRHMEITLANQLALAYPRVNVREVLKLAGTKWNVGTYHPSFGTGGYCIPLSSQYVLEGAELPEELTLLSSTVRTDMAMRERVADSLIERGCTNVGILGLSYRGNLKVSILSPTIGIAQRLLARGIGVRVYDPYYGEEDIRRETGASTFVFPDQLTELDAILVTADHSEFATREVSRVVSGLPKKTLILDNYGLWSSWRLREHGFEYYVPGDPHWLGNSEGGGK